MGVPPKRRWTQTSASAPSSTSVCVFVHVVPAVTLRNQLVSRASGRNGNVVVVVAASATVKTARRIKSYAGSSPGRHNSSPKRRSHVSH
ncbi:hypothetical protein MTO96_022207 [Rhipicephalus appendiculatus]